MSVPVDGALYFDQRRRYGTWQGDNVGPFNGRSSSSEHDNEADVDLEALKWAALEKLPIHQRLYTAILDGSVDKDGCGDEGAASAKQVDVRRLKKRQRQQILEKAFATQDQENERLLLRIKHRVQRVGIELPTVEVRFEHLSVSANVYVGSRALPTLTNFMRNQIEGFLSALKILPSNKRGFPILKDVSGVVRPGRMTLLLGPPGDGKSTLLRTLAGKVDNSLRKSGEVTYNGFKLDEFFAQRTAAYISQIDNHIGELTVRETLDFAARCQGVGYKYDMLTELVRRERELNIHPDPDIDAFMKATAVKGGKHSLVTDYIMKVLDLEICADIIVGNEMLRGISGGQKKRVTTGEMVVGPKRTLFMDEISTGLDSATTFHIVKCVRNFVHLLEGTVLMSLLQPAPETFELFDDVLLLAEGLVVYLGPRERILDFFQGLGFSLTPRKGIADFLQEVTSLKDQHQYWADKSRPYEYVSVLKMANAFKSFDVGKDLGRYLAAPFDKANNHPAALAHEKYALSKWDLFKACLGRELLLIFRHRFLYVFRTCQVGVVACIMSTLYLHTRLHPVNEIFGSLYLSTLFFALVHMIFNGFSEMSITVARLAIFYKQRDNLFYPSWAFSIPSWILRLPYSMVEAVIWSCIVYYIVGLAAEVGRFFRYMLLLFLIHQMAIGLFRLTGAIGRNMVVANTFGSFALMIVFLLGGFVLTKNDIPRWWIWGYWISPLSYAQNAISVNEFLAIRWLKPSLFDGRPLYLNILHSRGLQTTSYWYWIGVGVLTGYIVLFNIFVTFALENLNPVGELHVLMSEEIPRVKPSEQDGDSTSQVDSSADHVSKQLELTIRDSKSLQARTYRDLENGMILPFQALCLSFRDLNYYVDMPREMKEEGVKDDRLQLLHNVSGVFRPGILTALVGVSGAGKTTLMDVLSGRKTGGFIEGDIRVSGYPKVQRTFARICGYVEQTDIHSPQVTVLESLLYSSWLRLPRTIDPQKRFAFVEAILDLVELNSLRNALVGLPGRTGLSTEQRKRLTIAVELVSNPSMVFMDEPTSGLDARAAAIVMRTVRNTVDTGRTVVCTIHQPSIDIFEAFDELLLLKRGGEVIYAGPLGDHSKLMIEYFQDIPGVVAIKEGYNPATWMLEVSSQAEELRTGNNFAEIYSNSELCQKNKMLIEELSSPALLSKDLEFPSQYAQEFTVQLWACLWKQHLTYWRSPFYNVVRMFFTIVSALIFGSIFWKKGSKRRSEEDVSNVMGALYSAVLFLGVNNASTVQPVVSIERAVYYRERAAGMYGPLPYALAQSVIELPYIFMQTILYGIVTYSMIHFDWAVDKFFWYLLFMFLTFTYFTYYGIMAVALTPSQQLAAVVSSAFYSLWNLFSGFLIPRPRMPQWWVWFTYLSPVYWTLQGLVTSQLGDLKAPIQTSLGEMQIRDFISSYYGFKHELIGVCAVVLLSFVLLFWSISAFSLKYFNFQRR